MDYVYVKLFNIPSATVNGREVSFPFRKAEALFYYLVVNKEATRDELSELLWPDAQNEIGRKNIRDAVYKIKKCFGIDVLISPKKPIIMLNPEIRITSDLDALYSDEGWLESYTGDFLQGLDVKDAEMFEEWLSDSKEKYRSFFLEKLYEKTKSDFLSRNFAKAENQALRLIDIDQYDEKAYRILMRVYAEKGLFKKAADIYSKLSDVLKKDLGVMPDIKSRNLYQMILKARNRNEIRERAQSRDFFYGRVFELDKLQEQYSKFIDGYEYRHILVTGEAGIGKTKLKDRFIDGIDQNQVLLLESSCYQAEEGFLLRCWEDIFSKIHDIMKDMNITIPSMWQNALTIFTPRFEINDKNIGFTADHGVDGMMFKYVEDVVLSLLKEISKLKKVVIVLDDIQWMDSLSMSLLQSILLHIKKDVLVICLCRDGIAKKKDEFISYMIKLDRLIRVQLNRFTREEVIDFVNNVLPGLNLSDEAYENIYSETEGNTFFMVEYINLIREKKDTSLILSRAADILKSRFIGIDDEEQKILNIISVFFDEVPIDMLVEVSGMDEVELLDILDDLKMRSLIRELKNGGKPAIMFTHQKLREFVYNGLLESRKQMLHERIGRIIEKKLQDNYRDVPLYSRLVYHFYNSGNLVCALKYDIKNANFYFDLNHELFPVIYKNYEGCSAFPFISEKDTSKYMDDIEQLLNAIKQASYTDNDVIKLEIAYLHMRGRYYIRDGMYEKGTGLIKKMIKSSLDIGDIDYALKGCRQMIYYGIQVRNIEVMAKYIDMGLKMSKEQGWNADMGMFLRLKGLYKIMVMEYYEAEELLKECIGRFKSVEGFQQKYSIHIAAAYSYIGDIRRYSMRFQSSKEYYDMAISICENNKVLSSLTIFCTNAGQAAFDMGDYISAKSYFKKAIKVYKQIDSYWGRGIAEGYMALLLIREGNLKDALLYLKDADESSRRMKNPYEIGILNRVKAEIRSNMDRDAKLCKVFSGYLDMDTLSYCQEGLRLLERVNDKYQMDIIKVFMKQNEDMHKGIIKAGDHCWIN